MRYESHLIIAILSFVLYAWLGHGISFSLGLPPAGFWPAGLILAIAGAALPDILEPATSSRHRGFFHSRGLLAILAWAFLASAGAGLFLAPAYYCSALLLGYGSHLLADSTTKAGLPQ